MMCYGDKIVKNKGQWFRGTRPKIIRLFLLSSFYEVDSIVVGNVNWMANFN